ncbi:hypothetical protein RJ641_034616 [Dillenia turbinata]|uniref:RNI-like superfamily protein n=1 Tax=Dillenia turbinata TaxID=194707 RepID=A0AAN8VQY9_9MAGN
MEKEIALVPSLKKLNLNSNPNPNRPIKALSTITSLRPSGLATNNLKAPNLLSLCLGVIGKHLEDIIADLDEIAVGFPADIKMALVAIARRRKLLNDDVLLALADSSWEILDISGSDVSDFGLAKAAEMCKALRAVDISRCDRITALGVSELVEHCRLLETLRCGGCPRSDSTARKSLSILKPKLNDVEEESWEELDATEIAYGAVSLRWLVWPKIDNDSRESLSTECPRVVVNPKPTPFDLRGIPVPIEALPDRALDDPIVKDIDPKTWALCGFSTLPSSVSSSTELSMAEKFRLAFVERDQRLAPKRAKNARQHQRRAEREWVMNSTDAKAIALATRATKSLHSRN